MKKVNVIVYTMKGCPFCQDFKKLLEDEKIDFVDRDIHEHEQEYDTYSKITGNDMIPALLIIEGDEKNHKSFLYAPERNYNELTEALELVKKHLI
jgi:glutaredoxin